MGNMKEVESSGHGCQEVPGIKETKKGIKVGSAFLKGAFCPLTKVGNLGRLGKK